MKVYINGEFVDEADAKISVFDHGLLYGDGVFEGIRAYHGRVFKLKEHVVRLRESAQAIAMNIPLSDDDLADAIVETCRVNDIKDGYIRPIVTRGVGTLGLNPYKCEKPQVIIIAANIQLYPEEHYEKGLKVVTVGTMRNHVEAINPRIKSLNYLNNVMAKIEAINSNVLECIMLNPQGFVAEASGDNVFVVKNQVLVTPPAWCGALKGVTRDTVMELAQDLGYEVKEDVLTRYDLFTADELFLTGTAAEVIPVVEVDKRRVGNGEPGVITRQLMEAYAQLTRKEGAII